MWQGKFTNLKMMTMVLLFIVTTTVGIAIGMFIFHLYDENSPYALMIGVYMALVDILSPAFSHPVMKSSRLLQLAAFISLLLGAGCMSLVAKWA